MKPVIEEILINADQITEKCKELGQQITNDFQNHEEMPLFVTLLKGGVPFLAELIKYIDLDIMYDFMDVSSYEGTKSTGDIRIVKDLDISIKDMDIILVEDIIDTGRTLLNVIELLKNKGARDVKVVSLLNKQSRREAPVQGDYIGFEIQDKFVIGFGLDYNQKYRNLPYIGVLKEEVYK